MIRPSAVAGLFYPADPTELRAAVQGYLDGALPCEPIAPKALIVPHAAYVYAGPIMGTAYACLRVPRRVPIRRVVLLGTAHRATGRGLAVGSADGFATPLGVVRVDRAAIEEVSGLPGVVLDDRAHCDDHALEVQLPFLQEILEDFAIVPILVGTAEPDEVAAVLDRLWDGDATLIVVSSDLSHYGDYVTARRLDRATARAIEQLRPEDLEASQACGARAIAGLLLQARAVGLHARTLDLRSSGDTAGSHERVVGYGAFALTPQED